MSDRLLNEREVFKRGDVSERGEMYPINNRNVFESEGMYPRENKNALERDFYNYFK